MGLDRFEHLELHQVALTVHFLLVVYVLEEPAYDLFPHFVLLHIAFQGREEHLEVLADKEEQSLLNQWRPELGLPLIGRCIHSCLGLDLILDWWHVDNLVVLQGGLLKHLFVALLGLLLFLEVKHDRQNRKHDLVDAYLRFKSLNDGLLHEAEDHQIHFDDVLLAG